MGSSFWLILTMLLSSQAVASNDVSQIVRKKMCAKYSGKLLGWYGDVFEVKNCERVELSEDELAKRVMSGWTVTKATAEVIAAIPERKSAEKSKATLSCTSLNGKYITYSFGDIYFVEKCKKRVFPDWETFDQHRGHFRSQRAEIVSLEWVDFANLRQGKPIDTILVHNEIQKAEDVDVIPVDEACAGINGKYVSFYSKVYKIEKCRRRELSDLYLERHLLRINSAMPELTPEQWVSLPSGPRLSLKKESKNQNRD